MPEDATPPFWQTIALDDMSDAQWESLCDGCGRCCLQKLEDADSGEIFFTNIACRLLVLGTCRCSDYADRFRHVSDCTQVRPLDEKKVRWLPDTCAYRLLAEKKPLPHWHPLVSGDKESVHKAGVSVRNYAVSETQVDRRNYEEHIIHFANEED